MIFEAVTERQHKKGGLRIVHTAGQLAGCCKAHACRRKLVLSARESMSLSLSLSNDSGSIRVSTYRHTFHVSPARQRNSSAEVCTYAALLTCALDDPKRGLRLSLHSSSMSEI